MAQFEVTGHGADPSDIASIQKLTEEIDATWNQRDAKAFAALFEEKADFQFHNGTRVQGRDEIETFWGEGVFPGMQPGLRHISTLQRIRFIRDDAAICDGRLQIIDVEQEAPHTLLDTQATVVVVKQMDNWILSCVRLIVFEAH